MLCPSQRLVAFVLIAFMLALPVAESASAQIATPISTTKGRSSETRYPQEADQLLTVDGVLSGWTPISIRYYDADDSVSVFVELRNDTGSDQLTPQLYADMSLEGASYGQDSVGALNAWTPSGESAFFESSSFYSGSLALGDWDAETWYVTNDPYNDPATQDTSRVSIKDGRIANETDTVVGPILFATIVRDGDGVFSGGCTGPLTGANIPPGKSIRIRGVREEGDSLPSCVTLSNGMAASEELGVTGDFVATTIIASISEP